MAEAECQKEGKHLWSIPSLEYQHTKIRNRVLKEIARNGLAFLGSLIFTGLQIKVSILQNEGTGQLSIGSEILQTALHE